MSVISIENKVCLGCGTPLQNTDANQPGYVLNFEQAYCQSCYRVRHYGDLKKVDATANFDEALLQLIAHTEALFVWVVDCFHLEESIPSALIRAFQGKDVLLVMNKRDIFPRDIADQKFYQALIQRFSLAHISLKGVCFVAGYGKDGTDALLEQIAVFKGNRDVYVCGCVNVGKSTLINALTHQDVLTSSPIPSTTASPIPVHTEIGVIYDTPGFAGGTSLYHVLNEQQVKLLQPTKTLKPLVFQLTGDQTLLIGGLGSVSFYGADHLSVVCYLPNALNCMRIKTDSLAKHKYRRVHEEVISLKSMEWIHQNWKRNRNFDLVLLNIGFLAVKGNFQRCVTQFDQHVECIQREAII